MINIDLNKIRIPGDLDACWEWTGCKRKGYGQIRNRPTNLSAHRVTFELATLIAPGKLSVLHTCDNPSCVNPSHLFLGTYSDNAKDRAQKKRGVQERKTHCPQGHPYSPDNTKFNRQTYRGEFGRICRTCARVHSRNSKRKARAKRNQIQKPR